VSANEDTGESSSLSSSSLGGKSRRELVVFALPLLTVFVAGLAAIVVSAVLLERASLDERETSFDAAVGRLSTEVDGRSR
jgi:hypothetical protein